jgi:hypothetical protein
MIVNGALRIMLNALVISKMKRMDKFFTDQKVIRLTDIGDYLEYI